MPGCTLKGPIVSAGARLAPCWLPSILLNTLRLCLPAVTTREGPVNREDAFLATTGKKQNAAASPAPQTSLT